MMGSRSDVPVIGAGTAGASLAARRGGEGVLLVRGIDTIHGRWPTRRFVQ